MSRCKITKKSSKFLKKFVKKEKSSKPAKKNDKHKKHDRHEKPVKKEKPVVKEEEKIKMITIPEVLTIKELADHMKIQPSVIVKKLFMQGKIVTMNQEIDYETAEEIAMEFEVLCEKEEVVDLVNLSYAPGQSVNLEFDVTSFMAGDVSVDPFGTAFDIYIDAPMLQIDETSEVYTSGKVTKHPTVAGRYVYHVAASREDESRMGERKRIPFSRHHCLYERPRWHHSRKALC